MRFLPLAIKLDYTEVFEYIRPPEPSAATLWWMLVAVGGMILLFVIFEVASQSLRKKRAMEQSRAVFNQLAHICQLNPEETKLLKHLVGVCGLEFPDRLFTSFELFNACLQEKGPAASGPLSDVDAIRLRILRNRIFFQERSRLPPIKTTHELKSNQWLHLKRAETGEVFMAPVVEAGASGLLVATPREENEYVELKPGERLGIYFWRDRDASYYFESEVVGQSGTHSLITILRHVENVERFQRRQYHRVETSIRVVAIPVTREELDRISWGEAVDTKGHPGLQAYVVDISGAGFGLASRMSLKANDLVYLEIPTGEGEGSNIPVIGKILSVTKRKHAADFLMHAEFVGLGTDNHERIFQLIYSHAGREALPSA